MPGTGTGASQTFILHANDPNGYAYMPQMQLLFNPLNTPPSQVSGAAACYIYYERAAASISLINDAGTAWLGPVALGSSSPLGNSQCTINAAQSNTNGTSVNDLYLNLAITLAPGYAGQKSTYEYVVDHAGQIVGWNAVGTWTIPTTQVITSSPVTGLQLTVDGAACLSPCTFQWVPGSNHTLNVASSPQAGAAGTQYLFGNWSDAGAQSHSITAPSSGGTYTANFTTQYFLTTTASPATEGSISPASGWYNSGAVPTVSETPLSGNQFLGFSGGLSGTSPTQSLTMNAPVAVTANFSAITSGSGWFGQNGQSGQSGQGGSWTNRKTITVNGAQVMSSLANFPVVLSVTDPDLVSVSNGGFVGRPDGTDILFTASDGSTKLNHEIETYNPATGQLIAWIQAPFLEPNVNTVIYMYYGNPLASTQANPTGTWDSHYQGVWHLPGGVTLNTADTVSGITGSPYGVAATTGKIGGGVNVGGGLKFLRYSGQTLSSADGTDKTISLWVNPNSLSLAGLVDKSFDGGGSYGGWGLWLQSNGKASWWVRDTGSLNDSGSLAVPTNAWTYLTATWSASSKTASFYVNGVLNSALQNTGIVEQSSAGEPLILGAARNGTEYSFLGSMDEVQVSNAARSAGWIQTQYYNQVAPLTFLTVGPQLYLNPPAPLTMSYSTLIMNQYTPFSWTLIPTGGIPPYTWTVPQSYWPAGLTFSTSGAITGTPTQLLLSGVNVPASVTDRAGSTLNLQLTIIVSHPTSGSPTVGCSANPNPAAPGQTVTFTAAGANGTQPYNYAWSGVVSGGLSTGTTKSFQPSAAGIYTATVTMKDAVNPVTSNSCTVSVQGGGSPLTISSSGQLPGGAQGSSYSTLLTASGGTPPYTWSLQSGTLPPGLALSSNGALSGTPTAVNSYSFTLHVADSASGSASSNFSLIVGSSLTVTTSSLPNGYAGSYYAQFLTASGGVPPYRWSVSPGSSLPAGLTLAQNGALSGTLGTAQLVIDTGIDVTDATGEYISYLASYLISLLENQPPPGYDCTVPTANWVDVLFIIPDPDNPAYDGMIYAYDAVDFPYGTDPLWTATLDTQLITPGGTKWPAMPMPTQYVWSPGFGFGPYQSNFYATIVNNYCANGNTLEVDSQVQVPPPQITSLAPNAGVIGTVVSGIVVNGIGLDDLYGYDADGNEVNGVAGFDIQGVTAVQVTQNGQPTAITGYVQSQTGGTATIALDLTAPGVTAGNYDVQLRVFGFITPANPPVTTFTVADTTPYISSVTVAPALTSGSSATATILGTGFGRARAQAATLLVCQTGVTSPCAPTGNGLNVDVTVGAISSWSATQIVATLNAESNANGVYDVQVVSGGASGGVFTFAAGTTPQSSSSNRKQFVANRSSYNLYVTTTQGNGANTVPVITQGCAWISAGDGASVNPAMPTITAKIVDQNGNPPAAGTATWRIATSFNFNPGVQALTSPAQDNTVLTGPVSASSTMVWQPVTLQTYPILGGDSEIFWNYTPSGGPTQSNISRS